MTGHLRLISSRDFADKLGVCQWCDCKEYHPGVATYDGAKKPAWWTFRELLAPSSVGDAPCGA